MTSMNQSAIISNQKIKNIKKNIKKTSKKHQKNIKKTSKKHQKNIKKAFFLFVFILPPIHFYVLPP